MDCVLYAGVVFVLLSRKLILLHFNYLKLHSPARRRRRRIPVTTTTCKQTKKQIKHDGTFSTKSRPPTHHSRTDSLRTIIVITRISYERQQINVLHAQSDVMYRIASRNGPLEDHFCPPIIWQRLPNENKINVLHANRYFPRDIQISSTYPRSSSSRVHFLCMHWHKSLQAYRSTSMNTKSWPRVTTKFSGQTRRATMHYLRYHRLISKRIGLIQKFMWKCGDGMGAIQKLEKCKSSTCANNNSSKVAARSASRHLRIPLIWDFTVQRSNNVAGMQD